MVDLLVGASYRLYHLNSNNTIFYEPDGPISTSEYGAYAQLQKELLNDVLKLTASGRYDKNENFEGRFTPRITATVKVAKDNNFRLSYQQAYRFPDNQDQWINLQTPGSVLIGCLPAFSDLYHFDTNPVYTATSVVNFRNTLDPTQLEVATFTKAKPETMESYEVGYRGVINNKLLVDAYYYFSKYKNFIAREAVARGDSSEQSQQIIFQNWQARLPQQIILLWLTVQHLLKLMAGALVCNTSLIKVMPLQVMFMKTSYRM